MNGSQVTNDRIYEITAAMLAMSVIGGAVLITVLNLYLRGAVIDPPGWLQTAVGAVIGFYFARRSDAQQRLNYLAAIEANGERNEGN